MPLTLMRLLGKLVPLGLMFLTRNVPVSVPSLRIVEGTRGEWFFVGVESPAVTLTDPVTDPVTPWVF